MKKIQSLFLLTFLITMVLPANSGTLKSTAFYYDEDEMGTGTQSMRYIVNDQFMRIDNGDDSADFILFDVSKKTIYSINHDDQTILKIENNGWAQPEYDFKVNVHQSVLKGAPKIHNKTVYTYYVNADNKACTEVFLIKDTFNDEMKVMYEYQRVLSGQQVATLKNTPVDMHTPCFLVDQVYHNGDYYKVGLPVKISYSRDYSKFLKDFKRIEVDAALFTLPEGYGAFGAYMTKH